MPDPQKKTYRMGKDAIAYEGAAGATASTEIDEISDLTLNIKVDKKEVNTRRLAKHGFKGYLPGLTELEATFDLVISTNDPALTAIRNAFTAKTPLSWKFVDSSAADAFGVEFDGYVFDLTEGEPLDDVLKFSVSVAPVMLDGDRAPKWLPAPGA